MIKFNPVYRITVYKKNEEDATVITLPLTASINITRSLLSDNTNANISILNLSSTTRAKLHQAPFHAFDESAQFVTVEAGYGSLNSLYMIFKGRVMQCYSTKQGGGVDISTIIEAQPFDIYSSYSSHQFEAGTSYQEILNTLASDMPNCILSNIGSIEGTLKTPTTIQGNTLDMMNKITGGNTFIDNGQINTILGNECIDVPVPVITDSNALLETPKRSAANLTIKILFEPSLILAQLLEIHSSIAPEFDGQYKVVGFTHDLYFSDSTEGQRTTTAELWNGKLLQNTPIYISGDKVQESFNKVKGSEVQPVAPSKVDTNWIMPCNGRISSPYGWRIHPIYKTRKHHDGVDIAVSLNTPVKAVADGKVKKVFWNGGYGKYIEIEHGNNLNSFYGHLNSWNVNIGDNVKQGQIIAKSGNTAGKGSNGKILTTGPHLHLGAHLNGKTANPLKYIKN